MKQALSLLALLFFTTGIHAQQDLPEAESKAIVAEIKEMMSAFHKGDAELLINKTHPAVFEVIGDGDQAEFKKTMAAAVKQMMEMGIKFEAFEVDEPGQLHKAGKESVCFVTMNSVMSMAGQKMKSSSFMIAAKGEDGEWKYLDGNALQAKPDLLWTFFPDLPKDVKIPSTSVSPVVEE